MTQTKNRETIYTADTENKKIRVVREFDAPIEKVWQAWTDSKILDQWWAPNPWKARTQSMDFRNGGRWYYYMEGPEGERHYCMAEYSNIVPQKSYGGIDAFCDENGNINKEMPVTKWYNVFTPTSSGTKVEVELTFDKIEDLNKMVEMGFKEGFAAAHENLDKLLSRN